MGKWLKILLVGLVFEFLAKGVNAEGKFPIVTTTNSEFCGGGAFDGTNFLVGITEGTGSETTVTARIFSQTGTPVGEKISIGSATTDFLMPVAFDGTNFLIIWQNNDVLYGQFINTSGGLVGTSFQIESGVDSIGHIGFGGGNYLVVYNKGASDAPPYRTVYGKIITPSGSVDSEFKISSGAGKDHGGFGNLAFDGTNFLVVWTEDSEDYTIMGRFVSPQGVLGTEFTINASISPSDNPTASAFDGTNYLVVWPDEIGGFNTKEWALFGQFIDKSGNRIGEIISITETALPCPVLAPAVVFDGTTNYLITWNKSQKDLTDWNVYGRFVNKNGSLVGPEFAIDDDAGNQLGGAVGFVNGKYLIITNDVIFSQGGDHYEISGDDVYGEFKTIVPEVKGDMNTDGIVDITDVIKVLRKAIGLD